MEEEEEAGEEEEEVGEEEVVVGEEEAVEVGEMVGGAKEEATGEGRGAATSIKAGVLLWTFFNLIVLFCMN